MEDILEELFNNYFISNEDLLEEQLFKTDTYKQEQEKLIQVENKLLSILDEDTAQLLFDYMNYYQEEAFLEQKSTFEIAFKMGARMVLSINDTSSKYEFEG